MTTIRHILQTSIVTLIVAALIGFLANSDRSTKIHYKTDGSYIIEYYSGEVWIESKEFDRSNNLIRHKYWDGDMNLHDALQDGVPDVPAG